MSTQSLIISMALILITALLLAFRQQRRGFTFVKTFIAALIALLSLFGLIIGLLNG